MTETLKSLGSKLPGGEPSRPRAFSWQVLWEGTVLRGICLFVFKVFWDISAEILTQSVRAGAQRSAFILFFYILRMSLHHAFFFLSSSSF